MFIYERNRFESATRSSYRKMLILIIDHLSRLYAFVETIPFLQTLLDRTVLVKNDYIAYYTNWRLIKGKYEGETVRIVYKINELMGKKISKWEATIRRAYAKGSADYTILLPDGSKPFQRGPYDVRINAIKILGENLKNYSQLAGLRTEVLAYYEELMNVRDVQQRHEALSKEASDSLQKQRIKVARIMFANAGLLMDYFKDNPGDIKRFFDVTLVKSSGEGDAPDNGGGDAEIKFTMVTDQSLLKTVELGFRGLAGKTVIIHWGDGQITTITFDGLSQFFNHEYAAAGVYTISVTGDISVIEEIHSNSSGLISFTIKGLNHITSIILQDNSLVTESVNELLIYLDKLGIENGIINLIGGDNAEPTGAGLKAKQNLILKNWTVLTN